MFQADFPTTRSPQGGCAGGPCGCTAPKRQHGSQRVLCTKSLMEARGQAMGRASCVARLLACSRHVPAQCWRRLARLGRFHLELSRVRDKRLLGNFLGTFLGSRLPGLFIPCHELWDVPAGPTLEQPEDDDSPSEAEGLHRSWPEDDVRPPGRRPEIFLRALR